jgi:predicted RNA binding protein YcfA (HicA-like mRNA interferase family)
MPLINQVHWKILEKIVFATGFRFARQEGNHRSYVKPEVSRPLVISTSDEVPVAMIRNNLKMADISR